MSSRTRHGRAIARREGRMHSRRLVTLAICLVLAACGGSAPAPAATPAASAPPAAATATPLVPIAVKAAFTNLTGDSLPIWTAMDAGIFKKNGLDVDLQSIDGGARGMAALLANGVEIISVGGAECLSATAAGAKITVTAVLTPVFPYHLMAAPEIKSVQDLKGKKIGISSPGGSAAHATRKALQVVGLDPDRHGITFIAIGPHARRTAEQSARPLRTAAG